jgi:hypothetical protein
LGSIPKKAADGSDRELHNISRLGGGVGCPLVQFDRQRQLLDPFYQPDTFVLGVRRAAVAEVCSTCTYLHTCCLGSHARQFRKSGVEGFLVEFAILKLAGEVASPPLRALKPRDKFVSGWSDAMLASPVPQRSRRPEASCAPFDRFGPSRAHCCPNPNRA